jgi:hypothetical protein
VMNSQLLWCTSRYWCFELLTALGYKVLVIDHEESGRLLSLKAFLTKLIAIKNVAILHH